MLLFLVSRSNCFTRSIRSIHQRRINGNDCKLWVIVAAEKDDDNTIFHHTLDLLVSVEHSLAVDLFVWLHCALGWPNKFKWEFRLH